MTYAAVALGGSLGAVLRWWLGDVLPDTTGFPWTTFAINLSGCFVLGALPAVAAVRHRPVLAAALGPGLLGGYTTMSAFAEETRTLLADGRALAAATYTVGTLGACLVAVALAERLARRRPSGPVVEP